MPCCWSWCLGFYDQWEQEPWSGPHGHRGGCPGERYRRLLDLHRLPLGRASSLLGLWGAGRERRRSACVVFVYVVMLDFGITLESLI